MRAIIIVTSFLLLTNYCEAQDEIQKFRFGLQFSPVISWLKPEGTTTDAIGQRIGFQWGLTFEHRLSKNYSFAIDLAITNGAGGKLRYSDSLRVFVKDTFVNPDVSYKIQYLAFPASLKLKTNEIGYITYFGQFGVIPGINLKVSGDAEDISGNQVPADTDFSGEVSSFHIGLLVGLGIEYSLGGNTALTTGLFFQNGFTDVTTQKPRTIINNIALKLGVIF